MNLNDKIYVAGHRGLVGSAILRALESKGYDNILTRTRQQLDLINQDAVSEFFAKEKPDYVFMCAAKVGGILANNTYRADFLYENLMLQNHVLHTAYEHDVKRLLFLGSSCIYPRDCPQPMKEEHLLSSPLEQTNEPYAIAKIAGVKLCEAYNAQYGTSFVSVMPTNLYGPNDNFDLQNSHVLAALIRKVHEAKMTNADCVVIWGSGSPKREFLHVDDLADACIFIMEKYPENELINIGSGEEITIKALAELICDIIAFNGQLAFDVSKPDGTPRKLLDSSKLAKTGWKAPTNLRKGIEKTYTWYCQNVEDKSLVA